MKYEPFDAPNWFIQLGAEPNATPSHRAIFATMLTDLYEASQSPVKPLKILNIGPVENALPMPTNLSR